MSLSFRLVCPHCKEPTRAPAEAFYRWWPNEDANGVADPDSKAVAAVASYCPECENLLGLLVSGKDRILRPIISEEIEETDWGHFQADLSLQETVPPMTGPLVSKAVPKLIRDVLPALSEDVARRRNPVGCLHLCRSVLENALRELETETDSPLSKNTPIIKRIERLREKGIITSVVAEWAHEIRLDGNRSTHELVADSKLAIVYFDFLLLFLEVAFDLPAKIITVKAHKARSAKPNTGRTSGIS